MYTAWVTCGIGLFLWWSQGMLRVMAKSEGYSESASTGEAAAWGYPYRGCALYLSGTGADCRGAGFLSAGRVSIPDE